MKITLAQLKKLGACEDQVALFRNNFGEEVEATEALCVKHAQKFNWNWAANNLLSAPARRAYDEAMASAQQAYEEATAPAQRAYEEATAPARRAYDEATASAQQAYEEAMASAQQAYEEATARAFARAAINKAKGVTSHDRPMLRM